MRSVKRWKQRKAVVNQFSTVCDEELATVCDDRAHPRELRIVPVRHLKDREAPNSPPGVALVGRPSQKLVVERSRSKANHHKAWRGKLVTKGQRLEHQVTVSNYRPARRSLQSWLTSTHVQQRS